ncbi:hypothetical protein [Klebsiella oxytoca]|uniref:hypothetical protein n=1 Tax=Klebsiella oxytoca TaxID=571 RepID=UPI00187D5ACB|nr:hypothetical protein [Klebsiella oxytoca]
MPFTVFFRRAPVSWQNAVLAAAAPETKRNRMDSVSIHFQDALSAAQARHPVIDIF